MKPCPNCQQPVSEYAMLCPNCGYSLPTNFREKRMTGIPWVDVLLGALASLISPILFGLGIVVAIVFCCVFWRTYSYFARGLLIGLVVWGVLILGALALCIGIIATAPR